jgi:hypothetical protein
MERTMIRHVILIKFKQSASLSQIDTLRTLFESMSDKITGVVSVEWGVNDSEENKNKGYTHSVLMTFDNEEARQHYLPHTEHDKLKEFFRPLLEDIIVFDYHV